MSIEEEEFLCAPPLEYDSMSEASPVFGYEVGELEVVDDDLIDNLSHQYTHHLQPQAEQMSTNIYNNKHITHNRYNMEVDHPIYTIPHSTVGKDPLKRKSEHQDNKKKNIVEVINLADCKEDAKKPSIFDKMMSKGKNTKIPKKETSNSAHTSTNNTNNNHIASFLNRKSQATSTTTSFATCPICEQEIAVSIIELHVEECITKPQIVNNTKKKTLPSFIKETVLDVDKPEKTDYRIEIGGNNSTSNSSNNNNIFTISKKIITKTVVNSVNNNTIGTNNNAIGTIGTNNNNNTNNNNDTNTNINSTNKVTSIQHYAAPDIPVPSSRLLISSIHPESHLPQTLFYSALPSVHAVYTPVNNTYLSNSCVQVNMQEPCLSVPLVQESFLKIPEQNLQDVSLDLQLHTLKGNHDTKIQTQGTNAKLITPVIMCYLHVFPTTTPVLCLPTETTDSKYISYAVTELSKLGIEITLTTEKPLPLKYHTPLSNFKIPPEDQLVLTTRSIPWSIVKPALYSPSILQEMAGRAMLGYQNLPPPPVACMLPPSVLKSFLQKAIRRSDVVLAKKAVKMLAHTAGIAEVARRLPIIAAEDAVCHPATEYMCFLSCVATKKTNVEESALKVHHLDELLTFAEEIASCQTREVLGTYSWCYASIFEPVDLDMTLESKEQQLESTLIHGLVAEQNNERVERNKIPIYYGASVYSLPGLALLRDISTTYIYLNECILPFLQEPNKYEYTHIPQAKTVPLINVTLRSVLDKQLGQSPCLTSMIGGLLARACLGGMHGDVILMRDSAVLWCIRGAIDAMYMLLEEVSRIYQKYPENRPIPTFLTNEMSPHGRGQTLLRVLQIVSPYVPFVLFPPNMPMYYGDKQTQKDHTEDNLFDLLSDPTLEQANNQVFVSEQPSWEQWLYSQISLSSKMKPVHAQSTLYLPWKISKSIKQRIQSPEADPTLFQTCAAPNLVVQSTVNSLACDTLKTDEFIDDAIDAHCSGIVNYLLENNQSIGKEHMDSCLSHSVFTPTSQGIMLLEEFVENPLTKCPCVKVPEQSVSEVIKFTLALFLSSAETADAPEELTALVAKSDKEILDQMTWIAGGSRTNKRAILDFPRHTSMPAMKEPVAICAKCKCMVDVHLLLCDVCGQQNEIITKSDIPIAYPVLTLLPPYHPTLTKATHQQTPEITKYLESLQEQKKTTQLVFQYYELLYRMMLPSMKVYIQEYLSKRL